MTNNVIDDIASETCSTYISHSTKHDITTADFKLFIVIWNQRMGMTTPRIHLQMADWLEWNWKKGNTRQLLMAFRSAGKSTIVGLFAAWLLYCHPNLRILVLAADFALAKKMVANVKRIIERHALTQSLKPQNADQWASDRFTVKRMLELRDPSMLAKGITSNITGSRADIIICDDVEVPNTCDTPDKRELLRLRLGELEYVLVPDGTQLYVGTPHHYNTIYAKSARAELGEDHAFLDGFKRLELPVLDQDNQTTWPERYTNTDIARMKTAAGPNRFASQMMLEPRNIAQGRLNPQLLKPYENRIDYTRELQTLFLGDKKITCASAYWDPAFGSAKGDYSVLAIIYTDDDGLHYLHHVEYIKITENADQDEATQQCEIVASLAKSHYLPSLTLETNGIGKFLPNMLRNILARDGIPCAVTQIHQSQNKADRIIDAFDAVMAAQRLYVHRDVLKTPFMTEMQEWQPGSNKGYDDGLDAVAGALAQLPDRSKRLYGKGAYNWMRGRDITQADTDFKL